MVGFFASVLHGRRRALAGAALAVLLSVPFALAVQHHVSVQASPYDSSPAAVSAGDTVDVTTPAGTASIAVPASFDGSVAISVAADGTVTLSGSQGAADAGQTVTICLGSVCKTVTLDASGKATVLVTASGIVVE